MGPKQGEGPGSDLPFGEAIELWECLALARVHEDGRLAFIHNYPRYSKILRLAIHFPDIITPCETRAFGLTYERFL